MKKRIVVWKETGATPLQSIDQLKRANPELEGETISYAGRLDPMAEGVLVLLVGNENKKRKKYENLKKEYVAEIVLGIATDTFDALGIIKNLKLKTRNSRAEIEKCIGSFLGKSSQAYPPYSSKSVKGKPLYWWARQNKLSEIEIPDKAIQIFTIDDMQLTIVDGETLIKRIIETIRLVKGDFRQEEIIKQWRGFGKDHLEGTFQVIKLSITCSSGTYIRRLASDIGEKLGSGAFCLSIKRTRIGDFTLPKGS